MGAMTEVTLIAQKGGQMLEAVYCIHKILASWNLTAYLQLRYQPSMSPSLTLEKIEAPLWNPNW